MLLAAYLAPTNRREFGGFATLRWRGDAQAAALRLSGWGGALPQPARLHQHDLLFHSHGLATATAVTIVFNWDMVSFVPLLGIQIGVVSLVGRYMGAGRPEIAERVTCSGLKMGWSYSSVILVLFVGFPNNWSRSFSPAARTPSFPEAAPLAAGMLRLAGLYVLADAMMVVFSGACARRRGYLLDHVHLGRIALASAASALHHSEDSAAVAPVWLALVILFLSLQRRFLPALPQRPLEDPDGGGRETVSRE